jgi:hypothetical protein
MKRNFLKATNLKREEANERRKNKMKDTADIRDLFGKTLKSIDVSKENDIITFITSNNEEYEMFHQQDCCESVVIEDICGDLEDLVGTPLLEAEEITNDNHNTSNAYDSTTWTFYKLGTIKGSVTIRWIGISNGYYSESVDFFKVA